MGALSVYTWREIYSRFDTRIRGDQILFDNASIKRPVSPPPHSSCLDQSSIQLLSTPDFFKLLRHAWPTITAHVEPMLLADTREHKHILSATFANGAAHVTQRLPFFPTLPKLVFLCCDKLGRPVVAIVSIRAPHEVNHVALTG